MVAQLGGAVNRLRDWRLVEYLPAIDAAHGDLPRGHQGPEQHGRRLRVPGPSDSILLIFSPRLEAIRSLYSPPGLAPPDAFT